jgi:hypothetical protein
MPEISDDDFKEFQTLRSTSVGKDLEIARANFRADNPHVPVSLINAYSGDPAGMEGFGKALLEQFPKPQVAAAPPQPVAPAAVPDPAAAPVAVLPAPAPPPAVPPIMATQMQPQPSPEAQRQAYMQGLAQPPATAPAPAPVPSPGSAATLTPQNAQEAETVRIREKMRVGRATVEEAQWLSQNGTNGFTAAMTRHAQRVRAVMGRG